MPTERTLDTDPAALVRPHRWRYLSVFVVPALAASAVAVGGLWSFNAPVVLFGLLPLIELVTRGDRRNMDRATEQRVEGDRFYDALLYACVPVQYALIAFFVARVSSGALGGLEVVGATLSVGMSCGVLGINVAHELGHRSTRHEQWMSRALLVTTLYEHFFVEHNRGHHRNVATPEDPASARYGEWLPAFLLRSISTSYVSGWRLEAERLAGEGRPWWSPRNEMIAGGLVQAAAVAGIAALAGPLAAAAFVGASLVGILLLESVNYIEHYGLARRARGDGRYERVRPVHSWDSDHPLGRAMLFELTRHSDHHAFASRPYPVLRHHDASPQLPTGYPGMIVLATVPPLFFRVMHPRIEALESGAARPAAAA